MDRRVIVTGGAGFIPSHLSDILVSKGFDVTAVDVFEKEECHNIAHLMDNSNFHYVRMNLKDKDGFIELSKDCDMIYHLAASSDIQNSGKDPIENYTNTFLTTYSVLEAMRVNSIKNMFFSSTSAVYGNKKGRLSEDTGDLRPISYYGASKLSSEAMISSYSYMNDFNALVFRFPNVVGPRLTHGVIFDFIEKLKKDPKRLLILGNGKQNKQYVHVTDLVKGIVDFSERMKDGMSLYNVSTESSVDVDMIADLVCERMGLKDVSYEYTGGECGWKGDVPSFEFDITKAKNEGWTYAYDSLAAVKETLRDIDF